MKLLNEVEPEVKVAVKKIDGGLEVKGHLEELGVAEGTELTVVATEPVHMHVGPISLKAAGREAVIARGWADKVYVEKEGETLPLLRLENGDKGTVKTIEGGKVFEGYLSGLGIEKGSEVEFLRHLPDDTLVLKIDDKEITMGEGQASKVLVEKEGKPIQINYLKEGEHAKISKVIGGTSLKDKFEQMGVAEGKEIMLVKKEMPAPVPKRGTYVLAKIGEQLVTIGHGLAKKVRVE
ncbi:MAG: FeoA domain-containing protein [Candidatus Syntrophoarchaeum sp.]|nr:FeoA domain-containing protein [Candidatus Syntrophoarchaeum sp.]